MAERMLSGDTSGGTTNTTTSMDMSQIGPGLGALVGGLIGSGATNQAYEEARRLSQLGLSEMQKINLPDIEKMKIYLEELQSQGQLNPYMETAQQVGDSRLGEITLDPRLRAQQMTALEQMSGIAQTGRSDIDRAAMEDMLRQSRAEETAARKSILENRAARGMSGSGDELASALGASQSAANQRSSEALKIAAQAMQNRMNALGQSANMASAIENSDYNRASNQAQANDAIARFNAQLSQNSMAANTATMNNAQQANLLAAQNLANANVDTRNEQQKYNKGLLQQNFDNQIAKATGVANTSNAAAAAAQNAADAKAKRNQANAQAVGTIGTAAGTAIGGPIGGALGGALGGAIGGML